MMFRACGFALVALASALGLGRAAAVDHPVSIIDADVFVQRFKTTARLRFYVEDLSLIQGMEPDENGIFDYDLIMETFAEHRKYLLENIQLRDIDGNLLLGRIVEVVDHAIPEEGIEAGRVMEYTLGMVVEYAYAAPPEFITIRQDVADPDYLYPSEVKVIVKQSGSSKAQATMLKPGAPETFRFDWSLAEGAELTAEDTQKWFDEQRESVTLGIESYSSTYAFLYIGYHEVRNEILVPLASLAAAAGIQFNNRDPNFLEIDEQDACKDAIAAYFTSGNPLEIDGIRVKPVVDRIDFYGLEVRDFVTQAARRRVSMASGRVGLILSYSTKGAPRRVQLTWDRFSATMTNVEAVVFPFQDAARFKFARYLPENTYVWENPGTPPLPSLTAIEGPESPSVDGRPTVGFAIAAALALLVSLFAAVTARRRSALAALLAAAALAGLSGLSWPRRVPVAPDAADAIFQQLHKNIFRAFDYQSEEDVYDALAASVDGTLLTELYLQIHERLRMQDQGGAVSRIDEVNFLDGSIDPTATKKLKQGFGYRCRWNLVGSIEHWGHIHQRSIEYEATFAVQPRERAWKITAMEIVDEQPPKIKTSVRRLDRSPTQP